MNCECEKTKYRSEEERKKINCRINKIIGQMNGIKNMLDNNRYCEDILIQLSAVEKSVKSLSSLILDSHLRTCLVEGIKKEDLSVIDEIVEIFKRF